MLSTSRRLRTFFPRRPYLQRSTTPTSFPASIQTYRNRRWWSIQDRRNHRCMILAICVLSVWGVVWPCIAVTEGLCSQLLWEPDSRELLSRTTESQQPDLQQSDLRQQGALVLEAVGKLRAEVAALSSRVPTAARADQACSSVQQLEAAVQALQGLREEVASLKSHFSTAAQAEHASSIVRRLEDDVKTLKGLREEMASLSSCISTIEKADRTTSDFQWLRAHLQEIKQSVCQYHSEQLLAGRLWDQQLAELRLQKSINDQTQGAQHQKQPATEPEANFDALWPQRVSYTKLAQTSRLFSWHGKIVQHLVAEAAWVDAWERSLPIKSRWWSRLFWKDDEHVARREEEDFNF